MRASKQEKTRMAIAKLCATHNNLIKSNGGFKQAFGILLFNH